MVQVGKDSGWGGACSVSSTGFKGLRLNVDAIAGRAVARARRLLPSRRLIKIFAPLSLAEKERWRMCNQYAAKAKSNYVKV